MKRFGAMEANIQVGTSEELEAKRKARMERFGAAEVQDAAEKQSKNSNGDREGGKPMNRRKAKLLRKLALKQGGGGKKSIVVGGGNG